MAYGPPFYDISKKANVVMREKRQASKGSPSPMYSSDWHGFQDSVLHNNKYIDKRLHALAMRASFALKRHVPIGEDGSDGHLRNSVKAHKRLRGGMNKDRTVYEIHGGGQSKSSLGKWNAAVAQSTFSSPSAYRRAVKGQEGLGPLPSWIRRAQKDVDNG